MLSVSSDRGRLKIRLPKHLYQGRFKDFYLGLTESPSNIVLAEKIAQVIEQDISLNRFDYSLEKYRESLRLSISELFGMWLNYKKPYWDEATYKIKQYLRGDLERFFPDHQSVGFRDAVDFSQYLLRDKPKADTFNRKIDSLRRAWEWLINMGFASENPWLKIEKLRDKNRRSRKPKPFSQDEISLLIKAFERDFPELLPFIQFMLQTGCRIGEAIGLRWGDLSWDCSKVSIRSQLVDGIAKSPKCGSDREFFLPGSLVFLLKKLDRGRPDDFIFLYKGRAIDRRNFRKRIWRPLLEREGIPYRKPSAFRHNFCSWLLNDGTSVLDAAKITGHDPRVLLDSYASAISQSSSIPDLFRG